MPTAVSGLSSQTPAGATAQVLTPTVPGWHWFLDPSVPLMAVPQPVLVWLGQDGSTLTFQHPYSGPGSEALVSAFPGCFLGRIPWPDTLHAQPVSQGVAA